MMCKECDNSFRKVVILPALGNVKKQNVAIYTHIITKNG